jgi:phospholipid/cholesterol/gamma-HCH transport system substrate-binding protein
VNYAVVGAFVLVLGAALIAGVLWLASGGAFQTKYDVYLAIMGESVAGLNLNAPVKYSGVEVGKVKSIKLDPDNPEQVRLLLAIVHGTPIRVDTIATLKTQGLTGIAYVELDGGARDAAPLRATVEGEYPVIRTKPSLSARLENILTTVLAKVDTLSSNLSAVLSDKNQAAFSSALADIATVTRTVAARRDTIDAGLANAGRTFENSSRISAQLSTQVEPMLARIGRGADAIEKMGNETAAASNSAAKTVASVGADVQRFTESTLPDLERALNELSALSSSLRRLSEQARQNPSAIVSGPSPVPNGPGETNTRPNPP